MSKTQQQSTFSRPQQLTFNRPQMDQRTDNSGLARLLDRIAKTEGPLDPNDRAVARIYAGYMASQRSLNRRKSDKDLSAPTCQ